MLVRIKLCSTVGISGRIHGSYRVGDILLDYSAFRYPEGKVELSHFKYGLRGVDVEEDDRTIKLLAKLFEPSEIDNEDAELTFGGIARLSSSEKEPVIKREDGDEMVEFKLQVCAHCDEFEMNMLDEITVGDARELAFQTYQKKRGDYGKVYQFTFPKMGQGISSFTYPDTYLLRDIQRPEGEAITTVELNIEETVDMSLFGGEKYQNMREMGEDEKPTQQVVKVTERNQRCMMKPGFIKSLDKYKLGIRFPDAESVLLSGPKGSIITGLELIRGACKSAEDGNHQNPHAATSQTLPATTQKKKNAAMAETAASHTTDIGNDAEIKQETMKDQPPNTENEQVQNVEGGEGHAPRAAADVAAAPVPADFAQAPAGSVVAPIAVKKQRLQVTTGYCMKTRSKSQPQTRSVEKKRKTYFDPK